MWSGGEKAAKLEMKAGAVEVDGLVEKIFASAKKDIDMFSIDGGITELYLFRKYRNIDVMD